MDEKGEAEYPNRPYQVYSEMIPALWRVNHEVKADRRRASRKRLTLHFPYFPHQFTRLEPLIPWTSSARAIAVA